MLPAPRLELPVPAGMCGKEDLSVFFGLGIEDRCPVCGDHVSGYHYGLQTCESCKGFFKRTVQNKKVYTCADSSNCIINKAQRKNCPYCRFRKCLDVGMKIEAVRENRVRGGRNKFGPMYKYHRALKLQAERYRQQVLMQIGTAFLQSPYSADIVRRFCSPEQKMEVDPSVPRLNTSQQQAWPPGPFIDDQAQGRMVPSEMQRGRQRYDSFSRMEFDPMPQEDLRQQLPEDFDVQRRQRLSPQKPMPNLEMLHPVSLRRTATVGQDYPASSHRAVPNSPEAYRNRSHSFPNLETLVEEAGGSKCPPGIDSFPRSNLDADGLTIPKVDVDEIDYTEDNSVICTDPAQSKSATPSSVRIPIAELIGSAADYEVIRTKFRAVSDVIIQDFKDAFIGRYDQPVLAAGAVAEELRPLLVQLFCRLCDQALFLMVEWVRAAPLFKQLKVEDQIKLIENCWSEILVIDLLYLQTRHDRADHLLMMSGHLVSVDVLELLGISDLKTKLLDLIVKMKSLDLHLDEVTCLKFLVLLNPDVGGLCDQSLVEQNQEKVSNSLMDYCSSVNCNRFGQLLMQLPEIQVLSLQVEDYLQRQCLLGRVPSKSILAEMLMSSSHC